VGFLGEGVALHPLPSRLGDLGDVMSILGIFQGLRILLVETMHYGTNQKFGQDLGGLCPLPQLKAATADSSETF